MKSFIYALFMFLICGNLVSAEWERIISPVPAAFNVIHRDTDANVFLGSHTLFKTRNGEEPRLAHQLEAAVTNHYGEPTKCSIHNFFETKTGTFLLVLNGFQNEPLIFCSQDKGESWFNIPNIILFGFRVEFEEVGDKVFLSNSSGGIIYTSDDDCATWEVYENKFAGSLHDIDTNTLFYLGYDMLKTKQFVYFDNLENSSRDSVIFSEDVKFKEAQAGTIKGDSIFLFNEFIYKSGDKGLTWNQTNEIADIFKEYVTDYDEIGGMEYKIDNNRILASMAFMVPDVGQRRFYILSTDYANSWEFLGEGEAKVSGNTIFILKSDGLYEYNFDNDELEKTDYYIPSYGSYRTDTDTEYFLNATKSGHYFREKGNDEWQKSDELYRYMEIMPDGKKYILDVDNNLSLKYQDQTLKLASNVRYATLVDNTEYGTELLKYSLHTDVKNYERLLLLRDNQIIKDVQLNSMDDVYAGFDKANTDLIFYTNYDDLYKKYYLVKENYMTTSIDSTELNSSSYLSQYSAMHGNTIGFSDQYNLFMSFDLGASFSTLHRININYFQRGNILEVYGNYFYFTGALGLLQSKDGLHFENILEDVTDAYVYSVEFINGKIYAYTDNGLFIGDAPTSVQEDSDSISFEIFPNPSSDFITLSYENTFDSAEIFDLNGRKYTSNIDNKQIDISNLPSGTYFLKIKSKGKAYLKQFVVAR